MCGKNVWSRFFFGLATHRFYRGMSVFFLWDCGFRVHLESCNINFHWISFFFFGLDVVGRFWGIEVAIME